MDIRSHVVLRTVICAACLLAAAPSFSWSSKYSPSGDRHDLYGDLVSAEGATRTIVIKPETKWVNVEGGEIIRFVVGDKSFGWAFNVGDGVSSFDLSLVAPPGLLNNRHVMAYVSPDPKYIKD
jgi:hypothetical protein